MKYTARLIGGPDDGRVVPIHGQYYESFVKEHSGQDPQFWVRAVYTWEQDGDEFIGRFVGLHRHGSLLPGEEELEILNRLISRKSKNP